MAELTITSANAAFLLAPRYLNGPAVQLVGFGTDAAFETENVEPLEAVMGVDGRMSMGWLPTLTMMTVTLQADSPSQILFENWAENDRANREISYCDAVIIIPSIQRKYNCVKGGLSQVMRIPSARKTMQARIWRMTWETVAPAPL